MRRTLAFLVLTILAAIAIGCNSNDQKSGGAANTDATGTTTYSNASVPQPAAAATPATNGASGNTNSPGNGGAAPKNSPAKPGIKPPTE